MIYIGVILFGIIFLYLLMIYIRKTMWDAVHRNLLDLEDLIEGRVFQRSFAARPVFHGKINNTEITINFSTAKMEGKRQTYVNLSLATRSPVNFTLAGKTWLEKQENSDMNNTLVLTNDEGREYVLRPVNTTKVKKLATHKLTRQLINEFTGLTYLFAGKNGMMCEIETSEIVKATQAEPLLAKIKRIHQFSGILR